MTHFTLSTVRSLRTHSLVALSLLASLAMGVACSSDSDSPEEGGSGGSGATASSGGESSTGGGSSSGGQATGSGGASSGGAASGGETSDPDAGSGGAGTGGAVASGGAKATGGAPATGGSKATGGAPATGGSKATGGAPPGPKCGTEYNDNPTCNTCMDSKCCSQLKACTPGSNCEKFAMCASKNCPTFDSTCLTLFCKTESAGAQPLKDLIDCRQNCVDECPLGN